MRVLLLEDDPVLMDGVRRRLTKDGLAVDQAANLAEATHLVVETSHDCLVLDRAVPGGDALSLVGELRAHGSAVPILVVSGCYVGARERISALEAGADNFLAKPFDLDELALRVLTLCRRAGTIRAALIRVGDLTIDSGKRLASRSGWSLDLTAREFAILELLASRSGDVVTHAEMWERCWGEQEPAYSNALYVHVAAVRRKMGVPDLIRTRRGIGYSLEPSE
jgi:DNA-binding response OmpR family regulator